MSTHTTSLDSESGGPLLSPPTTSMPFDPSSFGTSPYISDTGVLHLDSSLWSSPEISIAQGDESMHPPQYYYSASGMSSASLYLHMHIFRLTAHRSLSLSPIDRRASKHRRVLSPHRNELKLSKRRHRSLFACRAGRYHPHGWKSHVRLVLSLLAPRQHERLGLQRKAFIHVLRLGE